LPAGERIVRSDRELPSPAPRVISWILFLLGAGAVAWAQWNWTHQRLQAGLSWMLGGLLLVAFGCAARRSTGMLPAAAARTRRRRLAEACFLVALTVAGGAVRFVALDRVPPGGYFDEMQNLLVAEGILKGDRPIFIAEATQMPALFFYLLAGAIAVAGKALTTVRGLSALFGTLTLPAFYLLTRRAFAWPVAAATAILLAFSRWHITFSRVGFVTIIGPLIEILAILCLWKALETRRRLFFMLLGIVVGIGLQCYYSFNLFPAVFAIAVLSFAGRNGWRRLGSELLPILRGLCWSVLLAVALLLPLARFAVRNPKLFFQRSGTVAIWNPAHHLPWPAILWQNTATHLLMFQYRGDGNPRHNIPDAPMLNPIEGFLLAVGLAAALARGWKWPQATWLGWFFVMLLPAILTIESPQAHRAVGAIPAVYLLIGQGLHALFVFAAGSVRGLRKTIVTTAMLVASLAAASEDLSLYFGVQAQNSLAWQAFEADHHAIARFLKPYENRYDIRVNPLFFDYQIERFYLGADFPYVRFRLFEHLPVLAAPVGTERQDLLYVLEPFQQGLFPLFHALYEHSRLGVHRDPFGRPMFIHIVVPRQDLERPGMAGADQMGFLGAYYANEHWTGRPQIVRREPAIWFHTHWHEDILPQPFTADWAAFLRIEEPGDYGFEIVTSGPTVLSFDQKPIFQTKTFDDPSPQRVTVPASRGDHLLVVSYYEKSSRATITLAWQPPSGATEVIPMRVLRPLSAQDYAGLRDSLPRPDNQE
jgi:hypothetical protein